jgi:hypothetical protein
MGKPWEGERERERERENEINELEELIQQFLPKLIRTSN